MTTVAKAAAVLISVLFMPVFTLLIAALVCASITRSFGLRKIYVNLLVKIFEYGRKTIERKSKTRENSVVAESKVTITVGNGQNGTLEEKVEIDNDHTVDNGCTVDSSQIVDTGHIVDSKKAVDNGLAVISREDLILVPDVGLNYVANNNLHIEKTSLPRSRSFETLKREFKLADCLEFIKAGVEAIIEDQVTSRFEAVELKSWNLLTRTNRSYEFISWRLTFIWLFGFIVRYCFLLPVRITIFFFGVVWLIISTTVVGYVPKSPFKRWLNFHMSILCFEVLSSVLSLVVKYHNKENRPKSGICVANHTSPIDTLVLMCDNCYSLIGQRHGGVIGLMQRALARASPHIWFERGEVKDRESVAHRMRRHVTDPDNPPLLIFPEGTCINNTSVMQFKKGSFEVGGVIYPVAIKYDARFGDAFWNSSRYSMMQYIYMMMSSWAIVCEVWYLPPMYQEDGESAINFANRVKRAIAKQGGLVDLMWDGQLKRIKPKKEWKEIQQEEFSKRLKVE